MKTLRSLLLILLGLTAGCEEANEWENDNNSAPLLVVEALLTNENIRHRVRLSETFVNLNDPPAPVSNAIVAVNDGERTMRLQEDPNSPGDYLSDTIRALFGKTYTLYVRHQREEHYAQAGASFITPLEPLIVKETSDGTLEFVYEESDTPSMTEVVVRWKEIDDNGAEIQRESRAFFYTLQVIDVNRIFAPDKQPLVFPKGATLTRRKYSLSKEHQEFLRSFLSEVEWRGGPFDVAPGDVVTNITNGALGYFSVSMVESDTTMVN